MFSKIEQYLYSLKCKLKSYIRPYNVLKIRNVDREYTDYDIIMLHANFSILCNFCEREMGGLSNWKNRIHELTLESGKYAGVDLTIKEENILINLYVWYNSINWNDPVPFTQSYLEVSKKVKYETRPVDASEMCYTLELVGAESDIAEYKRQQIELSNREEEFKIECQSNLEKLVSLRERLWY